MKSKRAGAGQRGAGLIQVVLVLVVIAVLTVIALKMYQRSAPPATRGDGPPARGVLNSVELRIEGLSSEADALQVTQALQRVPGVAAATTDASSGVARVTFSPARTNREQLVAAVERAGYRVAP